MLGHARWRIVSTIVAIFSLILIVQPQSAAPALSSPVGNRVLAHELDVALGRAQAIPGQRHVSSGPLLTALEASGALDSRAAGQPAAPALPPKPGTVSCPNVYTGAGPVNIRVNQDCSQRPQAEEVVAINPTNPLNLIAAQNDARIGFIHCGSDWSFDGGKTWGDQISPFSQFLLLDGHTADACTDPSASFDAAGNAYVGGLILDIHFAASAIIVEKSNAPIGGAFYHSPLSTKPFQTSYTLPPGVITTDNDANIFNDKPLTTADNHPSSPKANYVYGAWTRFNAATGAGFGSDSPIYFSQSKDGGATWSPGIEISGSNPAICTAISGEANANACDQDQSADPVVGRDGTIYVSFNGANLPSAFVVDEFLLVSCPPQNDCSNPASWTPPVRIVRDIPAQPVEPAQPPDQPPQNPVTGCPSGFQCLPPNGYRLADDTSGSLSVDNGGHLYFSWADFRNGGGSCPKYGSAATATPPCNNDVFYTSSTNGGHSWADTVNLTGAERFGQTAQWQPWSQVTADGSILYVAFYDREYGNCEFQGCNDITLAKVQHPADSSRNVTYQRITTSSMPNLIVAKNPNEVGFLGDYMWVTTDSQNRAYLAWADTRGLNAAVEEDIYFARTP